MRCSQATNAVPAGDVVPASPHEPTRHEPTWHEPTRHEATGHCGATA